MKLERLPPSLYELWRTVKRCYDMELGGVFSLGVRWRAEGSPAPFSNPLSTFYCFFAHSVPVNYAINLALNYYL